MITSNDAVSGQNDIGAVGSRGGCSVLALCPSLSAGGSERTAVNLARWLPYYGITLQVGVFAKRGRLFGHALDIATLCQFSSDPVGAENQFSIEHFEYARRVALLADRANPDLIVTLLPMASVAWRTALDLKLCSTRPWIALDGHNPYRWFDEEVGAEFRDLVKIQLRRAYETADRVVAASEGLAGAIKSAYGIQSGKVVCLYNPVDVEGIRRAQRERGPKVGPPVVITAARLVWQKGLDILLCAFKLVVSEMDAHLVILGTGPLRNDLMELTESLGLSERVKFSGFNPEPWTLFANADVFVFASRWEGFGHALVEAMAVGTPVVATDSDYGPRELLSSGEGLLVNSEDPCAIAAGVLSLLKNPLKRTEMSDRGSRRANDFSIRKTLPSFACLIRQVMSDHARNKGSGK